MKSPGIRTLSILLGLTLLIVAAVAVAHAKRARTMAVVHSPDGTSKAVVGKFRLCGLMGIEVVLEHRPREGIVTYASVEDLLDSWDKVERRYATSSGGGLLVPVTTDEPTVEK